MPQQLLTCFVDVVVVAAAAPAAAAVVGVVLGGIFGWSPLHFDLYD